MKYYLVIFSDYSETVGKQTSRAAMERDARQYCKMWGLSETVREVQEITAEEYSRRTGKPTEEPAEKPAKKKSNRIPRNARKIFVTWLIDTTGNKAGDAATVEKDDRGQWIETTASGERYAVPVSMLRNADIIRIEKIETTEDASETIPTEETAPAYIVQCRSPRRPWTDYSSPATLEECETIKERAEARRTCDVNGNLLQYRIAPAEAPQTATTDADGETSTAPQREPQRAAETAKTTAGGQDTTATDAEPQRGTEDAQRATTDSTMADTTTARDDPDSHMAKRPPQDAERPTTDGTGRTTTTTAGSALEAPQRAAKGRAAPNTHRATESPPRARETAKRPPADDKKSYKQWKIGFFQDHHKIESALWKDTRLCGYRVDNPPK